MNILAMDLGKSKTVFCDYDSKNGKHCFGKVVTRPKQIHDLLVESSPDRIVFGGILFKANSCHRQPAPVCGSLPSNVVSGEGGLAVPHRAGYNYHNIKKPKKK